MSQDIVEWLRKDSNPDRHYAMLDEAADEIERLRAELSAAQMMNSSLTGELAECQKELDAELHRRFEGNRVASDEWREECAAYEARIAELKEMLKLIDHKVIENGWSLTLEDEDAITKLLSRTDNLEVLAEFKDGVIEEVVKTLTGGNLSASELGRIRALKEKK